VRMRRTACPRKKDGGQFPPISFLRNRFETNLFWLQSWPVAIVNFFRQSNERNEVASQIRIRIQAQGRAAKKDFSSVRLKEKADAGISSPNTTFVLSNLIRPIDGHEAGRIINVQLARSSPENASALSHRHRANLVDIHRIVFKARIRCPSRRRNTCTKITKNSAASRGEVITKGPSCANNGTWLVSWAFEHGPRSGLSLNWIKLRPKLVP